MLPALLHPILGYEAQRKRLVKRAVKSAPKGALATYLSTPLPDINSNIEDVDIIALDFETSGLDARQDKLLSVGFVQLQQLQIHLGSNYHNVVHHQGDLTADNVVIHQLTDNDIANGLPLKQVLDDLLTALAGKVMLAHYAKVERQFLQQGCQAIYGIKPPIAIIDSLLVSKRRFDLTGTPYDPSRLRLVNLRQEFGLPPHYVHNALNDAIATAELLIAQVNQLVDQPLQLKRLLA